MNSFIHTSAKPSHYDAGAEHYDGYNEENSKTINRFISKIFKQHKIKKILDLTCGTGSQVFWLAKQGYEVVGSDINATMLAIAKSKVKKTKLPISLLKGDMRKIHVGQAGQFDAAITIFNAVGHLTKPDFEKSMRNINRHLKVGGLYVFDIFNLSYLEKHDHIKQLTIDWQQIAGNTIVRDIQYSTIDRRGVLASYNVSHVQNGTRPPKIITSSQTLQIYTSKQLKAMLRRNGFEVLGLHGFDGSRFSEKTSERLVVVARKR